MEVGVWSKAKKSFLDAMLEANAVLSYFQESSGVERKEKTVD